MAKVPNFVTLALISCLINFVAADCPYGIIEHGVSSDDIATAVNAHNDIRKLIANGQVDGQPRGINLKRLKWDDKLAQAAQDIADTCVFAHVPVNDDRWSWVGQNLFAWASTGNGAGANFDMAVGDWINEYKTYTFDNKTYNHYTQVVWHDTEYVGCGYTYYESGGTYNWNKLYVCNYGIGGNWVGSYPYEVGDHGCEDLC